MFWGCLQFSIKVHWDVSAADSESRAIIVSAFCCSIGFWYLRYSKAVDRNFKPPSKITSFLIYHIDIKSALNRRHWLCWEKIEPFPQNINSDINISTYFSSLARQMYRKVPKSKLGVEATFNIVCTAHNGSHEGPRAAVWTKSWPFELIIDACGDCNWLRVRMMKCWHNLFSTSTRQVEYCSAHCISIINQSA